MDLNKYIYVKNIVCTFKIKYEENFNNIGLILKDITSERKKFHGIIIKNNEYGCTFLFFRGGSVTVTGLKNIKIMEKLGTIFIDFFKKYGIDAIIISKPKIVNIIVTANLQYKINLESLKLCFDDVNYEPEVYSSAICKIKTEPGNIATIMLTNSGYLYCCGLRDFDEISESINSFIEKLNQLRIININNIQKFKYITNSN